MSEITRTSFVSSLARQDGALPVENLEHATAYALAQAGVGYDDLVEIAGRDGKVAGRREWTALFDRLDAQQREGTEARLTGDAAIATRTLEDEVGRHGLAARGGHAVVHLGLRAESAIEARALDRASGGRTLALRDTSPANGLAGAVIVGGERVHLETPDDLARLGPALLREGMSLDRALAFTRMLSYEQPAARDELLQLGVAMFRMGDGRLAADRLVISGHSSGYAWSGGDAGNLFTQRALRQLTELFPEGASRVNHLALAGCSTGTHHALEEYREIFPHVKSIWGYPGASPSAELGGKDLVLWEHATTKGTAAVDPIEDVATWNEIDGHQGPARDWRDVKDDVQRTRDAWSVYARGERPMSEAEGDRQLERHYRYLQELAGHPETEDFERVAYQGQLAEILKAWHPRMFDRR